MDNSTESQIEKCEDQLKQAMLESDVSVLDILLSPNLIFTNHLGQLMTKQDDIELHRSGILNIKQIILSNPLIKIFSDIAIVSAQTHITGEFSGIETNNSFRFTRVWNNTPNNTWQVIAGHSSIVV